MPIQHSFFVKLPTNIEAENNNSVVSLFFLKQLGRSMGIGIFIIIVSLLGDVLMQVSSTNNESVVKEVLGIRTNMAKYTAMQAELQQTSSHKSSRFIQVEARSL